MTRASRSASLVGLLVGQTAALTTSPISTTCTGRIAATRAAAEQQRAAYFALAPWEQVTKYELGGRPTTLDLRGFDRRDKGEVQVAAVLVNQEGLSGVAAGGGKRRYWRSVGAVAAPDKASLDAAVAKQRELIIAWADELVYDWKTQTKQLRLGADDPTVRIAWTFKPNGWKKMIEPSYQGELNEVALDTPFDESLQCGFFGSPSRPVKTGVGSAYTAVDLPT